MADYSIDSKLTSKVVSLVVAVVIFACVLVPICGAMATGGDDGGEVLYTNAGNYYYNELSENTQSTIVLTVVDNGDGQPILSMNIDGTPIDFGESSLPQWRSNSNISINFTSIPLFTFKTTDGKYGVEGIVSLALGDMAMDPEYFMGYGGLMYYRAIQGSAPEYYFMFNGESNTLTITVANNAVTYGSFNESPTPINGEYLLSITAESSGKYTLTDGYITVPTVLSTTEFYIADWRGSAIIESDDETGDAEIILEDCLAGVGYGTIDTIDNISNLSLDSFNNTIESIESAYSPAESGDGFVSDGIMIVTDNSGETYLCKSIVPTEIREGGSGGDTGIAGTLISIIPVFVALALILAVVKMFYDSKTEY